MKIVDRGWSLALLASLAASAVACEKPESHPFFELPYEQQDSVLLEYPLEEQVEIYVEGITRRHPRQIGLVEPLARNGEDLVPVLLAVLDTAQSEVTQRGMLAVLGEISCRHHDLSADTAVLAAAERTVSELRFEYFRELAAGHLAEIRREACPDSVSTPTNGDP